MRLGQQVADRLSGPPSIHEIVDDQPAAAVAAIGGLLHHCQFALAAVVIAGDADGIDQPQLQLPRHDGGRHQAAARHGDDAFPRPLLDQPPGQRLGIAVQFVPGDGKVLLAGMGRIHGVSPSVFT
jgi:hypothetical protein